MNNNKSEFIGLLKSVNRKNTDKLISALEAGGFFLAPASTTPSKHNCGVGGLCEHSLNVCHLALAAAEAKYACMEDRGIPGSIKRFKQLRPSIIVAALLHDVGKMGECGIPYYEPNLLKAGKQSESKPYVINKLITEEHEVLSVFNVLQTGYELTKQERNAILYHNGLYGQFKYVIPGKIDQDELYLIITDADMTASRVAENPSWLDEEIDISSLLN